MMKRLDRPKPGIWTMIDGAPVPRERRDIGPAILAVPTEDVLLLAVDLPLARRADRLAALPFAIEDRIATPLAACHVALGPEIAPRVHLVAVVAAARMEEWTAALAAAGLAHAAIVPDALLLPRPPTGAWTIAARDGRVLVRSDDGGGFAVAEDRFAAAWTIGGALPCVVAGAAPIDLPPTLVTIDAAPARSIVSLDLRQGRFAAARRATPALWRSAAIVAVGLCAHTAIAAADMAQPRAPGGPPVATAPGGFLPVLARAARALGPRGGTGIERIAYDGDTLTIGVVDAATMVGNTAVVRDDSGGRDDRPAARRDAGATIAASLRAAGLVAATVAAGDGRTRVTMAGARFDRAVTWLAAIERDAGLRARTIMLTRGGAPGTVDLDAVLA